MRTMPRWIFFSLPRSQIRAGGRSISSAISDQDLRELAQRLRRVGELEEDQVLGHALEVVEDVVEVGGDGADVLAVEGGDEGGVQGVEDLAGDRVALVLDPLSSTALTRRRSRSWAWAISVKSRAAATRFAVSCDEQRWKRSSCGMNHLMMASAFTRLPPDDDAVALTDRVTAAGS